MLLDQLLKGVLTISRNRSDNDINQSILLSILIEH